MVNCFTLHNCMKMSELERDRLLTSGPARFQRLSAFHPTITARQSQNLGSKLSTAFPRGLFDIMLRLDVVSAHMRNFYHTDSVEGSRTREIIKFCLSLSNIYQVNSLALFFIFLAAESIIFQYFIFRWAKHLFFTKKEKLIVNLLSSFHTIFLDFS